MKGPLPPRLAPRPSRRAALTLLTGAGLVISGCAEDREASSDSPGPPAEGQELLFISPMGEPFRAHFPAPYPVVDWFKGADRNSDGEVDLAEFVADAERYFHVLDVNKDGVIDYREIAYYERVKVPEIITPGADARLRPPRRAGFYQPAAFLEQPGGGGHGGMVMGDGAPRQPDSNGPGGPPSTALVGAAPYNLLADPEPVRGSDLRLSGVINLTDFKTRAEQRFALLDERGRGALTLASLPYTQAQRLMPRRRGGRPAHSGA
jgi:hypothetical protein